jgi:single-strand DNA-binding protein
MASYNKVILIGRLTADPELRYTPSGKAVAKFRLAVDRRANARGERETDFINIVAWQKLAEVCSQYLTKGKLCAIDGRLQTRQYENKEGRKVNDFEVVAEIMQMLDRPVKAPQQGAAENHQEAERYPQMPEEDPLGTMDIEELPF